MLRSILLALDGITPDETALTTACKLVAAHGAALDIVMIPDRGDIDGPEAHGIGSAQIAEHRDEALSARLNARLQAERAELLDHLAKAHIEPNVAELAGDPAQALASASEAADLVILPSARLRTRAKDDIDSAFVLPIDRILRHLVRPALLVAEEGIGSGPVAVAYDGSESAQRSLQFGLLSGMFGQRPVVILSVGYASSTAEAMAAPAASLARRHGHEVSVHALEGHGEPADEIVQALGAIGPGLFVSGCFGEKSVVEWIFGGTTEHLLPQVRMPWLLQR